MHHRKADEQQVGSQVLPRIAASLEKMPDMAVWRELDEAAIGKKEQSAASPTKSRADRKRRAGGERTNITAPYAWTRKRNGA